ncbi:MULTISPECIES: DUF11 domain-containing protein [Chelativorans]|jgi:uncharacterized repeat protein (TIGR01451 family)|uniref:Conserved repeat domain n=1 Tax=Chelativorans sp. (strain BNC1) TaxID=266779 RepID=Q11I66_CHESB|nr:MULTISPECIES: DUF11 domain-containing protein [Chelativorans]
MPNKSNFFNRTQMGGNGRGIARISGYLAGAALGVAALASPALAAMPPAGFAIGNKAHVSFEVDGTQLSAESNLVQTIVNTVSGVTISDAAPVDAIPGTLAPGFFHVITNKGNGPEAFDIVVSQYTANVVNPVTIYQADCATGLPSTTALVAPFKTPELLPDKSFCISVVAGLMSSAVVGTPESFQISAVATNTNASNYNAGPPITPRDDTTDVINPTNGPVLSLVKSYVDINGGDVVPGDRLRFRIAYRNTGATGADAQNVNITDSLVPGLIYQTGTGMWNGTVALTENSTTPPSNGVTLTYNYATQNSQVSALLNTVRAQTSGFFEFEVVVALNVASATLTNQAEAVFDGHPDPVESNEVLIPINAVDTVSVVLADSSPNPAVAHTQDLPDNNLSGNDASATDEETNHTNDQVVQLTAIAEGALLVQEFVLTNTSSTDQLFNLTSSLDGGPRYPNPSATQPHQPLPPGTRIVFADYNLYDDDNSGQPDVLVPANQTIKLRVFIYLPAGYTRAAGADPWVGRVTATSRFTDAENPDPNRPDLTNSSWIVIRGDVLASRVDLLNRDGTNLIADGSNTTRPDGSPWLNINADPGAKVEFPLVVQNESLLSDSFQLSFSATNAPFVPGSTPLGYTVRLLDASRNPLSNGNTGLIGPNSSRDFIAEVTVPQSARPGTVNFYFRVQGVRNPALMDTKLDAVTVNRVGNLAIKQDQPGATAPGMAWVFSHVMSNLGNVTVVDSTISYDPPFPTFDEALYADLNGNGILDTAELSAQPITGVRDIWNRLPANSPLKQIDPARGLTEFFDPGESIILFGRVTPPPGALPTTTEIGTVYVNVSLEDMSGNIIQDVQPSNNRADEALTVVDSPIVPIKEQALDRGCNGTVDVPFTMGKLQGDPGDCIQYRVTVNNNGGNLVNQVTIDDKVPLYTTLSTAAQVTPGQIAAQPAIGATGNIIANVGTLNGNSNAVLTFTVKIDQ